MPLQRAAFAENKECKKTKRYKQANKNAILNFKQK